MKVDGDRDSSHGGSALAPQQAAAPIQTVGCMEGAPLSGHVNSAGVVTRAGFLAAVDLCVRFLAARLGGVGVTVLRSGDDTALQAETARTDLWRWLHAESTRLEDGTPVDFALFDDAIQRVGERLPRRGLPGHENLTRAAWLLAELTHAPVLTPTAEPP